MPSTWSAHPSTGTFQGHQNAGAAAVQYWKQVNSAKVVAAADGSSGFLAWAALGRMPGKDGTIDETADPVVRSTAAASVPDC